MKTKTIILCLIGIISSNSHAQKGFSFHGHIAPPMGNFRLGAGSDFNGTIDYLDPIGHAGIGIGLGVEYHHPFGDKGFHGLVAIDIIRNPIKKAWRKAYKLGLDDGTTIKYSSYYNAPISVGLHYQRSLKEGIALFGQVGGILDVLKISKSKKAHTLFSANISNEEHFALSASFGLSISVGVVLKDKYIIGLGYKALGIHNIRKTNLYITPYDVDTSSDVVQKQITLLNLTFGFNF